MPIGEPHHDDLAAALGARRDLGSEYDKALAESFVDRVSSEIDARVDQRVAEISAAGLMRRRRPGTVFLGVSSLVFGIPISAIAGSFGHLDGLIVAWGGIAIVNLAQAIKNREDLRPPRQRVRR